VKRTHRFPVHAHPVRPERQRAQKADLLLQAMPLFFLFYYSLPQTVQPSLLSHYQKLFLEFSQ
ncbi:hypothetical protein, partial [Pseudomonas sp. PAH14]|uniref:hypothetical protein n=1 Tax=Pseudomonas sp. PAH14 TaxID=2810315 RepID=UPI001BDC5D6E